jgi:hypothetical protein
MQNEKLRDELWWPPARDPALHRKRDALILPKKVIEPPHVGCYAGGGAQWSEPVAAPAAMEPAVQREQASLRASRANFSLRGERKLKRAEIVSDEQLHLAAWVTNAKRRTNFRSG